MTAAAPIPLDDRSHGTSATTGTDVFLSVGDLQARYGIGRTRVYQLIKEPWFPHPVVDGTYRWSLASLREAEAARALGPCPVPERPEPQFRRGRR
jgi:predicted DNA-binding transcriptional regulator AlpA